MDADEDIRPATVKESYPMARVLQGIAVEVDAGRMPRTEEVWRDIVFERKSAEGRAA